MSVFVPPTADTVPPVIPASKGVARRLFRHYKARACGRTVLKIGGTYALYDTPDANTVASASEVYMGGHVYVVDAATASALTTAGFGAYLT